MNNRAAAIIVDNDQILLIHRRKPNQEYYVLPGGSVEHDETIEEACIQEVKEETGILVTLRKKVYIFDNNGRLEHYFIVDNFQGQLGIGEPESSRQTPENQYKLEWVGTVELQDINLQPSEIRQIVCSLYLGASSVEVSI